MHQDYCNPDGSTDSQLQMPCKVQATSSCGQSFEANTPKFEESEAHVHIQLDSPIDLETAKYILNTLAHYEWRWYN